MSSSVRGSSPDPLARKQVGATVAVFAAAVLIVALSPVARAAPAEEPTDISPGSSSDLRDSVVEDVLVPAVVAPAAAALSPIGDNSTPIWGPRTEDSPVENVNGTVNSAGWFLLREVIGDDSPVYELRATWKEGPNTHSTDRWSTTTRFGIAGVPQLIDVTRDGVFDISVEVWDVTAQPILRVVRLPGSPTVLPASVFVHVHPEGPFTPPSVGFELSAFEYDERGFPSMATVSLTHVDEDSLTAQLRTYQPGPSLSVSVDHSDSSAVISTTLSPPPEEATLTS